MIIIDSGRAGKHQITFNSKVANVLYVAFASTLNLTQQS